MAQRKPDKQQAALAARRAKLADKNAKNRAKRDAILIAHPGLSETMDAQRDAIQKRDAARKADLDRLREHGYEDFASPPWLHLLDPMQRGWREKQLAKGRDPDAHIEQELREAGVWPPQRAARLK